MPCYTTVQNSNKKQQQRSNNPTAETITTPLYLLNEENVFFLTQRDKSTHTQPHILCAILLT